MFMTSSIKSLLKSIVNVGYRHLKEGIKLGISGAGFVLAVCIEQQKDSNEN
jgi:hypothetical protein